MPLKKPLSFEQTLFADDLHAKRVRSLAGATLGAIESASLASVVHGSDCWLMLERGAG